jgi:hypothetical protein
MTHPFVVHSGELPRGVPPVSLVRLTLRDTPRALLVVRLEVIQE